MAKVIIKLSTRGKNKGLYTATVDDSDADLAELNWSVYLTPNKPQYARRRERLDNGQVVTVYLHREIMERMVNRPLEKGEAIDHKDGCGLNCSRDNLRVAIGNQNQSNRGQTRRATSGYKGVYWCKDNKNWRSVIQSKGKTIHLGRFDTTLAAHRAYCKAAVELHGEFANFGSNSPFTPEMFMQEGDAA